MNLVSSDWPYASIDYLDVNGQTVNSAAYGAGGWRIDTTQYDSNGNETWSLTPGNQAQSLSPTADTDPYVASLSTSSTIDSVDAAALLRTDYVYNPLNTGQVTDTYGPAHPVVLNDGSTVDARTHVATTYDEGAPNNNVDLDGGSQPYGLPTTVTTTAWRIATQTDTSWPDIQVTHTGYDPITSNDTSGWHLGKATSLTIQMAATPSSADLVTRTLYDSNGNVTQKRLPNDTTGTTPRTTLTSYYTATGTGTCADPTRAGLVCSTAPAAQPSSGSPLPIVTYAYDKYGNPTSKTEAYGGGSSQVIRSTTMGFDGAERETGSSVSVSPALAGGTPVPTVTYAYDTNTGLASATTTGSSPSMTSVSTTYDSLGRVKTYTDATGNVSTTTYDIDSRTTNLNDGKGTTSYTYDNGGGNSSTEHRGMPTGEDIGISGAPSFLSATYDTAGNLATQTYPNGLIATNHYDNAGDLTSLVYSKSAATWITFSQAFNATQQVAARIGPQSTQNFAYDQADRLTTVKDATAGSCTTRAYSFDTHSNRTNLTTALSSGNSCPAATTGAATFHYDNADRLASDSAGSYTYDSLGRTLIVPSADANGIGSHAGTSGPLSLGYYANDMVARQSQGGGSLNFSLDPLQTRELSSTNANLTTTNHFSNNADSPTWTSTSSAWTREVFGISGSLIGSIDNTGTVVLDLLDIQGNIVATTSDSSTAPQPTTVTQWDEFGNPESTPQPGAFGWLGNDERSSDDAGGLIMMGVRLYNRGTGRFMSPDPIPNGNSNTYIYPADPVNVQDTTGRSSKWSCGYVSCTIYLDHQLTRWAAESDATAIAGGLASQIPGVGRFLAIAIFLWAAYIQYEAWHAYDGDRDLYIKVWHAGDYIAGVTAGSYCGAYFRHRNYCS